MCIGKCENLIISQLQKYSPRPANEFLLHTVGTIGKLKKKSNKKFIFKNYTSQAEELPFHKCIYFYIFSPMQYAYMWELDLKYFEKYFDTWLHHKEIYIAIGKYKNLKKITFEKKNYKSS